MYAKKTREQAPNKVPPEERLYPAFYGGPLLFISFIWFGWTSFKGLSIWAPLPSGIPMGIAVIWIFLALFNYIIDAYLSVAASALAANTVVRSAFGAGFPVCPPSPAANNFRVSDLAVLHSSSPRKCSKSSTRGGRRRC